MDERFAPHEFKHGESALELNKGIEERVSLIGQVKASSEDIAYLLRDSQQQFGRFRVDQMEKDDPALRPALKLFVEQAIGVIANPYLDLRDDKDYPHVYAADIIFSGATARRFLATESKVEVMDPKQRVERFRHQEYANYFDYTERVVLLLSFIPFVIKNLHIPSSFRDKIKTIIVAHTVKTYEMGLLKELENASLGKMFGVQDEGLIIQNGSDEESKPIDSLLPKPEELRTILENSQFSESDNTTPLFAQKDPELGQIFSTESNIGDRKTMGLIQRKGKRLVEVGQVVFDTLVDKIVDDFIDSQQYSDEEFSEQAFDINSVFSRLKKRRMISISSGQGSLSIIEEDESRPCLIDGIHDLRTRTWIEGIGLQNAFLYLGSNTQDQKTVRNILEEVMHIGRNDPERLVLLLPADHQKTLTSKRDELRIKREEAKELAKSKGEEAKASVINHDALIEERKNNIRTYDQLSTQLHHINEKLDTSTKVIAKINNKESLDDMEIRGLIDLVLHSLQN